MYEVFLNERSILIASPGTAAGQAAQVCECPCAPSGVEAAATAFLEGESPRLQLTGNEGRLWKAFRKLFIQVPAAGGLVFRNGALLFIRRRGWWDLPKGKQEPGETPGAAALREVREETGLTRLVITGSCPSTWHLYRSTGADGCGHWILKETRWFRMEANGNEQPVPETGEEITQVRWVPPDQWQELSDNTYASLRKLIRCL